MGVLVVVDKVAVGHVSQALAVAGLAALGGHHLVGDEVRQEAGAGGGGEAHVGRLHGGGQQGKDLVACSLHEGENHSANLFVTQDVPLEDDQI